jgi:ATP-dependent exoDNAse (exonuclease V) beta subunit
LVVTFNVGAAAEIKRRIVQILRQAGREAAAMDAETAPIQTIASFAGSILRENAFALGIDPRFEMLDADAAPLLVQTAVRRAISASHRLPEECRQFLEITTRESRQTLVDDPEKQIIEILSRIRKTPRGHDYDDAREYFQHHYSDSDRIQAEWAYQLRRCLPIAAREVIPDLPYPVLISAIRDWYRTNPPVPAWTNAQPGAEAGDIATTVGAVTLAVSAWQQLDELFAQQQKFDFTAVEGMALRLLTARTPALRAAGQSIRARFDHVIVDEAQDIDPLQDALLTALDVANEMRVGDAQQSIYGFRLADPEGFADRSARADWQNLTLSTNYRSAAPILDFVNAGFRTLWGDEYLAMAPSATLQADPTLAIFDFDSGATANFVPPPVEAWDGGTDFMDTICEGVANLVSAGEPAGRIAVLLAKNNHVTQLSHRLESLGIRTRVVGGAATFYSRMEIRDVANTLRSLADPADDFSLLAALHSPMGGVSLDATVALALDGNVAIGLPDFAPADPRDSVAINQFLEWFTPISRAAGHLPAWEIVARIIAESPFLERLAAMPLGARAVANVRKLQLMAIDQPTLGAAEFADSIAEIQTIRHQSTDAEPLGQTGDADRVTILTIHQAKGAEYPITIVPTTALKLVQIAEKLESDLRLPAVVAKPGKGKGGALSSFLQARREERNRAENLRRMYVALTRAQDRLIIVKDTTAPDSPLQQWFKPGGPAAAIPIRSSRTP